MAQGVLDNQHLFLMYRGFALPLPSQGRFGVQIGLLNGWYGSPGAPFHDLRPVSFSGSFGNAKWIPKGPPKAPPDVPKGSPYLLNAMNNNGNT